MGNEKYQIEIKEFTERFLKYKNKKIILYGIGRYTATLLEGLKEFRFVGLMDKNPENIGKTMFNLPIVDKYTAEKIADIIIINTAEIYWHIIYNRIADMSIPIYYKNGKQAKRRTEKMSKNPLASLSYESLHLKIESAEIISFDFFDTLFSRSVCNPGDVMELLQIVLWDKWKINTNITEMRNRAKCDIRKNYSLDELYMQIQKLYQIPAITVESIKNKEIEIEKLLLIPRSEVITSLKYAMDCDKEVYIISDMYLPLKFYREVLEQYGILIPEDHILLSNMLNVSKNDGTLWVYYSKEIVKGRSALHIGDNRQSDIEQALQHGIDAYLTPGIWELLLVSSIREVASHICCAYDTSIMGCVLGKLFQNPYVLKHKYGVIKIANNYEMGYCVFGPVILTFLLWLIQQSETDCIKKIVFMSRDGFFLKDDFEYLCELRGEERECCYLEISRQLVMTAAVESREDLFNYASMPYSGSIPELLEDRFSISNVKEIPDGNIVDYLEKYSNEIERYIFNTRKNYLCYVKEMKLDDTCAVVDLGYYGNNQRYLNKLIRKQMPGYYFSANISKENINSVRQKMTACFQSDETGENSQIYSKIIYLESFLTAPCGMIKSMDKLGDFTYAEKMKNQVYFREKIEINQGVKEFMKNYIEVFGKFDISLNTEFVEWFYGYCFSGAIEFSDTVKKSFYNDNGMMNRFESNLFC